MLATLVTAFAQVAEASAQLFGTTECSGATYKPLLLSLQQEGHGTQAYCATNAGSSAAAPGPQPSATSERRAAAQPNPHTSAQSVAQPRPQAGVQSTALEDRERNCAGIRAEGRHGTAQASASPASNPAGLDQRKQGRRLRDPVPQHAAGAQLPLGFLFAADHVLTEGREANHALL